jgi:hypothetical protein
VAILSAECSFLFVAFADTHVVERVPKVDLGEILGFLQKTKDFGGSWRGSAV